MSSDNENTGNFDLSTVFKVQSNYLSDISNNVYNNVANASEVAQYVYNLQDKLQKTSQEYQNANTSSGAVLSEQDKVIDILNNEQTRLNEKQQIIDNAITLEERKDLFTNTMRLKYTDYTKMMLVVIICLCIHIGLRMLSGSSYGESMGQGGHVGLILVHIANIVGGGIFIIYLYLNMQARSDINYNHLSIPPPNPDNFIKNTTDTNFDNIFNSLGICYGDGCCGPNTKFNKETGQCDPIVSAPDVSAPISSNTSTSDLGGTTNTRTPTVSPGPIPSPGISPGPSPSTDIYSAAIEDQVKAFYKQLGDTEAFYDKVSAITDVKVESAKRKKYLKNINGINIPTSPSPSPNTEGFVTFNELYNINNDLLPCKVEYPYKNSSNAQPNDNVRYMKAYK